MKNKAQKGNKSFNCKIKKDKTQLSTSRGNTEQLKNKSKFRRNGLEGKKQFSMFSRANFRVNKIY